MMWYKMKDIRRLVKIIQPKGFFRNFIAIASGGMGIYKIYQEGIRLVNDNGDTKDVWAKKFALGDEDE